MNRKKIIVAICLVVLVCGNVLSTYGSIPNENCNSLFSWRLSENAEDWEQMFAFAKSQNVKIIHQWMSDHVPESTRATYINKAHDRGLKIYMLSGDPTWSTNTNGREIKAKIDWVNNFNKCYPDSKIDGITFDIEPYTLKEWNKEKSNLMKTYVSSLINGYAYANENNVPFSVCIPYFYDSEGYKAELKKIFRNTDMVMVMNYYRDYEQENIRTEVQYAKKYNVSLVTIYEFQKPGKYDLVDENTYYNQGIDKMNENFNNLIAFYPKIKLHYGMHEYEAILEVINNSNK